MMKIERKKLLQALDVASLGVTNENARVTSHVFFDLGAEQPALKATNRISWISVPIEPVNAASAGSFTVEASRLKKFAGNVMGEDIRIETQPGSVTMHCGEGDREVSTTFPSYDPDNFPDPEALDGEFRELFRVDAEDLLGSLSFVEPFLAEAGDASSPRTHLQITEIWDGVAYGTNTRVLATLGNSELESTVELYESDLTMIGDLAGSYGVEPPEGIEDGTLLRNELHEFLCDCEEEGEEFSETDESEMVQDFLNGVYAPFRVSRSEIGKLVNFLKKTSSVDATVCRFGSRYVVETVDGSIFGFTESSYELPDFRDHIDTEFSEPHRWEVARDDIKRALAAISAGAADDDDILFMRVASGEEPVMELRMDTLSSEDQSVFPIPCTRLSGDEEVEFKVNSNLVGDVLDNFEDGEVQFGFKADDDYLKIQQDNPGEDYRFCLITLTLN